ncbi:hypothetical protein DY000_02005232 [Brassica cretica]|uniref:Uncharacterized protein n=1 Tax=Brassica cretica TaxID=69181 RepID=A0ABQ7C5U5_BRACR|nr:hypothetical protein DY000_02005232 [Brassica cretica]
MQMETDVDDDASNRTDDTLGSGQFRMDNYPDRIANYTNTDGIRILTYTNTHGIRMLTVFEYLRSTNTDGIRILKVYEY